MPRFVPMPRALGIRAARRRPPPWTTIEADVLIHGELEDDPEADEHQGDDRDRKRDYPTPDRRSHGGI